MDSINAMESFLTRRTPPALHGKILRGIADIAGSGRNFELGINCTVSHVTANWITVHDMLKFGAALDVDFVKFQPIFDDGYVSGNSPDLLLGAGDAEQLLEIARRLGTVRRPPTNPPGFWRDVAALAGGRTASVMQVRAGPVRRHIGWRQAEHMLLGRFLRAMAPRAR